MKLSLATLLLLPSLAAAFAPAQPRTSLATFLNGAKTFEEDLELTREVIAKFIDSKGDAAPVEKEEEPKKAEKKEE
jgi:hypothetical protein